jgi:uncharacterized membrane protein
MGREHRMADAGVMTHATRTGILGGRTLFRLGLTLLVLSAVLFLRHSIEQGWIGPEARVALAAAGGLVLVGTGLAVRRVSYGVALQAAGTAVLFLTGFAAHDHYGLTSTTEAFVQLVAVAALTMGLASRARSELLAGLALTAAAGSPALIDGRVALPLAETAYVAAVGGIGILLFHRHGWIRSLVATALAVGISVALDLTPRLAAEPSLAIPLQASLVIAWAMLVLVPISAARRGIGDRMARVTVPIVTSSFATLGLYAATRLIFDDTGGRPAWAGLALGLGLVHLLAWRLLRGKPESAALGAAQWIPITAMSMVAVVEGLTGDWILAGLSMMALGLVLAGHRGIHARLSDAGHLLFGVTAVLAVGTVAIVTGDARRPEELVPGLLVLASAAAIGWVVRGTSDDDLTPVYAGAAYLGALGWVAAEIPRLGAAGTAWVTGGWTLLGVAVLVGGRLAARRSWTAAGFATIGLALGKLFFVDLATASTVTRIGLFAGLGLLLAAAGYWLGDWSLDDDTDAQPTPPSEVRRST